MKVIALKQDNPETVQVVVMDVGLRGSARSPSVKVLATETAHLQRDASRLSALLRRFAGKTAWVFPHEHSYIDRVRSSKGFSRREWRRVLEQRLEWSVPLDVGGYYRYAMQCNEMWLHFMFPKGVCPFADDLEMDRMETNPGALFHGLSSLFSFRRDARSLLFVDGGTFRHWAWGTKGVLEGLRDVAGGRDRGIVAALNQIVQSSGPFDSCYSWCGERVRKILDEVDSPYGRSRWIHLPGAAVSEPLNGDGSYMPAVCAGLAMVEGRKNPWVRLWPAPRGVFSGVRFARVLMISAALGILCGAALAAGLLGRLKAHDRMNAGLEAAIRKSFYERMPPATPMLNPVRQLQEHLAAARATGEKQMDPARFLAVISGLARTQPEGVEVERIECDGTGIAVSGKTPRFDAVTLWMNAARGEGLTLKLEGMERDAPGSSTAFRLRVLEGAEGST